MRPGERICLSCFTWIAVGMLVGTCLPLEAAQPVAAPAASPFGDAASDEPPSRGIFATPDRLLLRLLGKAEQLVGEDRYAEAVRCLGAILESPEDYFYQPEQGGPVHRSLKSEAQRMLGQMPRRGRELYELQYGAHARQLLLEAAAAGDPFQLAEVSRRFFHTQAGYEATLLLGIHHLSEGRPLAAALTLERLRDACPDADRFEPTLSAMLAACWIRCQMPEKAWHVLADLKQRFPQGKVTIAGREVPLFSPEAGSLDLLITEEQAIALLASGDNPLGRLASVVGAPPATRLVEDREWAMPRGNAARTASVSGSAPLMTPRWRVPTTDHPYIEALISALHQDDQDHEREMLPVLQPLVIDNVLLMRTARNLLAVDFNTGKRLWQTPMDDPFEEFLNPSPDTAAVPAVQLGHALRLRMWGDATYGTISSDGQRVFAVEDLGLQVGAASVRGMLLNVARRSSAGPSDANRLAAYDIHTGKLMWHIGGSEEEYGLPQAGAFFLGPPLPLMKQLFVMAEIKGEIRLFALDAKTGEVLWSQQLADADRGVALDPFRRFAGLSPSYADGIIVCPTSSRAIVAVELATRSLLWGYTYSQTDDEADQPQRFLGSRAVSLFDPSGRWTDASLVLSEGCVVATPLDSSELHCLSLIDGSPRWKKPRDGDLYLGCVYNGKVVMVGREHVRALDVDTGEPAWDGRTVPFPDDSTPSGTGFQSGNLYFVPLTSAEVMAVNLETGRQASISRSRRASVPGNLVCYKDKVISQRAGAIEVYYQLDALAKQVAHRLAAEPDDPDALVLQAEILWHEDKLDDAIRSCRQALEAAPPALREKTRDLLREAYFEGLERDFAAHRTELKRIESLIDTPRQTATLLRLLALGHEKQGEFHLALENCLSLIDVDRPLKGDRPMEPLGRARSVRLDRWIQVQLAHLHEAAPADVREQLDAQAELRLQSAIAANTVDALEQFLDYFGGHPTAEQARKQLVGRYRTSGRLLEAELLLRRRERSQDVAVAGGAVAELAQLLEEAGRHEQAAACYDRLRDEFAKVVCRDGKTGEELCNALPPDSHVREMLAPSPAWPTGNVDVADSVPAGRAPATYLTSAIDYRGSTAPFMSGFEIELTPNPAMLTCRDDWGNSRWQLSLADLAREQGFFLNRNLLRAAADGHLLVMRTGDKVTAIDLLGEGSDGAPRILWSRGVEEPDVNDSMSAGGENLVRQAMAQLPGGAQAWLVSRTFGMSVPSPVLAGEELACMMRLRSCIGLDPVTGKTVWIRHNLAPDSDLFGDRDYVFVAPPGEREATVLRTIDGHLLGTRPIAAESERLATFGRRVLVWKMEGNSRRLEMSDPWSQTNVWPAMTFAGDAQIDVMERAEKAAVLERDGRFVLVDLEDGRTLIDSKLEAEPRLSGIHVLQSPDGYVLVIQAVADSAQRNHNRQYHPLPATKSVQVERGKVLAFDRQGHQLWESPRSIEDQYLLLDQPASLPLLVLACVVRERKDNRQYQMGVSILAIDKRDGRTVLDTRVDKSTNRFQLVGLPDQKKVEIQMQQNTVTLSFTDDPVPPVQEEAVKKIASGNEAAPPPIQAIWNAIRKAAIDSASKQQPPAERADLPQ